RGTYFAGWCDSFRINRKDSVSGEPYIYVGKAEKYNAIGCRFGESCDFSNLVKSGMSLEVELSTGQKDLDIKVYFVDTEIPGKGKENQPWRCQAAIDGSSVPGDKKWHKVRIPLKDFADAGAWSDFENKWYKAEGLFSWEKVNGLKFDFGEKGLENSLLIRSIVIK
ncbi:MAG: hypothetical protein II579_07325, partial [Treponema sp.]|nr:hypothetical protein [Treponema sp.]